MQNEVWRWPTVQHVSGLSRTTAWRLERNGDFPRRRKISANAVGWLKSEIEAWVLSRATADHSCQAPVLKGVGMMTSAKSEACQEARLLEPNILPAASQKGKAHA